jgi:predicted nucleic acid-binding protein
MERTRLILADTSAWIEYLRATESPLDLRLDALLHGRGRVATTDFIILEILAGARDNRERDRLKAMLYGCEYIRTLAPADYETAAEVHRACRRNGVTVRRLPDCLIAAVAMRAGAVLLHCDADFTAIARHVPLDVDHREGTRPA